MCAYFLWGREERKKLEREIVRKGTTGRVLEILVMSKVYFKVEVHDAP